MTDVMSPDKAKEQMNEGLIRKAFELRAKYNMINSATINLDQLAVHPMNRSGTYPNGGAVQTLGLEILRGGFSRDVAYHDGVAVQEVPPDMRSLAKDPRIRSYPDGRYMDYVTYNRDKTSIVPQLRNCFSTLSTGQYGTLAHSHLLLVLLSLAHGGEWNLDQVKPDNIKKCNDNFRREIV